MTCAQCGNEGMVTDLCSHHVLGSSDRWAESNRIICDFFHRGKEPARLPKDARAEEPVEVGL